MALAASRGVLFRSAEVAEGRWIPAVVAAVGKETLTLRVKEAGVAVPPAADLTVQFADAQAVYRFETKAVTPKPERVEEFNILRPSVISRALRRRYERVALDLPVEVGTAERRELVRERARLLDLSAGGAMVEGLSGRSVGEAVRLTFELSGGERMEDVEGMVMWTKPVGGGLCRYGVSFENLSEIRRNRIAAFVAGELRRRAGASG